MRIPSTLLWACVYVAICVRDSEAGSIAVARRQDGEANVYLTTSSSATQPPPSSAPNELPTTADAYGPESPSVFPTKSLISATGAGRVDSSSSLPTDGAARGTDAANTITSAINGPLQTPSGSPSSEDKKRPNALPLPPTITPAVAVSGVFLILAGFTYTLIGIKNKWVQIFLSSAFLTSLSVTVLLIYVMNPPVRPAVQGAYFVAAFMTGAIFGAGSLVFKEVTEGLGCLLGGFCLSMWLLALRPGGTLRSTGGRVIFIAVFTAAAYALSFSHYTRPYGLIGATSFAGATAAVLGIDCFSKAGLKEFWFYIWNLNDRLFPLNTNAYPITRGIRVELAVIVLICMLGVISQLKLWKVIKDRQEKKAAIRLGDERARDQVEEAIGRRLEDGNERERAQWEAMYGDQNDMERNKKTDSGLETEQNNSLRKLSVSIREVGGDNSKVEVCETRETSAKNSTQADSHPSKAGTTMSAIMEPSIESTPDITKIMSPIPRPGLGLGYYTGDTLFDSTATPTTVVEETPEASGQTRLPHVNATPSSNLSAEELEQLATRSISTSAEPERNVPIDAEGLCSRAHMQKQSDNQELTTVCHSGADFGSAYAAHSKTSSVAATFHDDDFDGPDLGADSQTASEPLQGQDDLRNSQLAGPLPTLPALSAVDDSDPEELHRLIEDNTQRRTSRSASSLHCDNEGDVAAPRISCSQPSMPKSKTEDGEAHGLIHKTSTKVSLDVVSGTGSLTKGALERVPNQLSYVVMSYRTNEWAKHIAAADEPEFDEPEVTSQDAEEELPMRLAERSTPIESGNLQHTMNTVATRLSNPQESTTVIPSPPLGDINRTLSGELNAANSHMPSGGHSGHGTPQHDIVQAASSQLNQGNVSAADVPRSAFATTQLPSVAARGLRTGSNPVPVQTRMTSPIDENAEADFPPPARPSISVSTLPIAGSTLLAQRDTFLRSKHSLLTMPNAVSPTEMVNSNPPTRTTSRLNLAEEARSRAGSRLNNLDDGEVNPPMRSTSRLSLPTGEDEDMPLSQRKALIQQQAAILFPENRLAATDRFDALLPPRSSFTVTAQKRESMLALWRESIRQEEALSLVPKETVESRRASMLMEKQQSRMNKQYLEATKIYQENAIDEAMRRGDLQELHKDALRRMQANANRHVS